MTSKTFDQVEATKRKAVRFVRDVLGDPERADEIEDESVESYAERKNIHIENPKGGRSTNMAGTATKAELEEVLAQVEDVLGDALDPKLTREEVVEKVEQAYDLLEGEEEGEPEAEETGEPDGEDFQD